MRRAMLAIAVGLSACGPLVPTGADGDTGGDTSEDGRATVVDEVGGEMGEDGVPPNPSDPSGPSDATADPDTGITVTATASTTEPPPEGCGDGVVDPDEECDDGDVDDGDACSSQCTITFEVDWTVSHDGAASSFDVANDLVVGPGDEVYVVGASSGVPGASDVWLQQILADGTVGWTFVWDGVEGLADEGAAIAWTADGHLVIVGSTESELTGSDVLVLVVDPATLGVVWSRVFDGPGSGAGEYDEIDVGTGVAVDPAGNIVVVGTLRVGPGDSDAWVAELSPDGVQVRWQQSYGDAGSRDTALAVIVDAFGMVDVLAALDDEAASMTLYFEGDGAGLVGWITHTFSFSDATARLDGAVAAVGRDGEGFAGELVTAVLDADWNPAWWQDYDASSDDEAEGIAAGPANEVAAVGSVGETGQQGNAWIAVYRDDGTPWWGDRYNNADADLGDTYNAVVFDSTGAVIAVGSETVIGQQTNALVRKYLPL